MNAANRYIHQPCLREQESELAADPSVRHCIAKVVDDPARDGTVGVIDEQGVPILFTDEDHASGPDDTDQFRQCGPGSLKMLKEEVCHRTIEQAVREGKGACIADVEVDPETGRSQIVRYTVIQDAGKAVHPTYVEGQFQGGAAQGIGWALNEEYIYGKDGRLQNAGFLDYRIPVCSDLPMIDTQILEIPNPNHPYGVRGVGETSIVPPLAAIANAMSNAFGVRMTHVPMSPPRVLKALEAAQKA